MIRRYSAVRVGAVLCLAMLAACDSGSEAEVLNVAGAWTSEVYQHRDLGQAVLEVTFEQDGADLSGSGILHLPQAGSDLEFGVQGTARPNTIQFITLYETAVPETVSCSRDSDVRLKCTKENDRFNLDRD